MLALLLAAAVADGDGQAIGNRTHPFFTRSYWANFDWASPESHAELNKLPVFTEYDPAKHRVFDSRTTRLGQISLDGITLEGSILERDTGSYKFPKGVRIVWPGAVASSSRCRSTLADLEAGLGPATVKNDLSFDAEQINTTHIRAQWDIGPTRVDLYCLIFDFPSAGPSTGAVMLHAWHVTTGDKDKPPTWIRCSRKMVVTRGPEIIASKELPDLVLMIDDVEKGVYGRDRKTLGVPSFSDGRIAVKRGADNTPEHDEFRIDRVTGEYREIRVRPRGVTGNVDGSCAPFDPSKPKF